MKLWSYLIDFKSHYMYPQNAISAKSVGTVNILKRTFGKEV